MLNISCHNATKMPELQNRSGNLSNKRMTERERVLILDYPTSQIFASI